MHKRITYIIIYAPGVFLPNHLPDLSIHVWQEGSLSILGRAFIFSTRLSKTTSLVAIIVMNVFDNYIGVTVSNSWVTRPPTKRKSKSKSSSVNRSMCTSGHTHMYHYMCVMCALTECVMRALTDCALQAWARPKSPVNQANARTWSTSSMTT